MAVIVACSACGEKGVLLPAVTMWAGPLHRAQDRRPRRATQIEQIGRLRHQDASSLGISVDDRGRLRACSSSTALLE